MPAVPSALSMQPTPFSATLFVPFQLALPRSMPGVLMAGPSMAQREFVPDLALYSKPMQFAVCVHAPAHCASVMLPSDA